MTAAPRAVVALLVLLLPAATAAQDKPQELRGQVLELLKGATE